METLSDQQQHSTTLSFILMLFTVFIQFHRRNIFTQKTKHSNHDMTVVYVLVQVEAKIIPLSMKDCAGADKSVLPEVVLWFPVASLPLVVHLRVSEATLTVIIFSCAAR